MITVAILINGETLMARSAVKTKTTTRGGGLVRYQVDDGSYVLHKPDDGAVKLAIELLKTIKGQPVNSSKESSCDECGHNMPDDGKQYKIGERNGKQYKIGERICGHCRKDFADRGLCDG